MTPRRFDHLGGAFTVQIAPFEDGCSAGVIGHDDDGGCGKRVLIAVKMEAFDIVGSDSLVLDHGGIGQRAGAARDVGGGDDILVPVSDALNDPSGLDIHKDGRIIGRVCGGKNADNGHFQRVDAIKVKQVFRGRDQRVAHGLTHCCGHIGPNHRIAQQRQAAPVLHRQIAKVKIVQRGAHDPEPARGKGGMDRDRHGKAAIPDGLHRLHLHRVGAFI